MGWVTGWTFSCVLEQHSVIEISWLPVTGMTDAVPPLSKEYAVTTAMIITRHMPTAMSSHLLVDILTPFRFWRKIKNPPVVDVLQWEGSCNQLSAARPIQRQGTFDISIFIIRLPSFEKYRNSEWFAPSGRKYKSCEMGKIQFAQGMWLRIAVLMLPRFCDYPIRDFAAACQLLGEYHRGVFSCFTA